MKIPYNAGKRFYFAGVSQNTIIYAANGHMYHTNIGSSGVIKGRQLTLQGHVKLRIMSHGIMDVTHTRNSVIFT